MTIIVPISTKQLRNRRCQLRQQRKVQYWQTIFRFLLISGLAGSLWWLVTLPNWTISQADRIKIEGNEIVSKAILYDLIPLTYPQSIFQIPTQDIVSHLEALPFIAEAKVNRQLFPPNLTIDIVERTPIALVIESGKSGNYLGFLDERGVFLPKDFYQRVKSTAKAPTLKVVGFENELADRWSRLYPPLQKLPLDVSMVDWRDRHNLILKTELGDIHLGNSDFDLARKLSTLAQMRDLPNQIPLANIDYIDIRNPDSPVIQLLEEVPTSQ